MKAFFGCSMRGRHDNVGVETLRQIQDLLENNFELTLVSRHQAQQGIVKKEDEIETVNIHDRDVAFIRDSDVVIVELSDPSGGVGAEVADAVRMGKPVLGVYLVPENEVSAYLRGKLERYERGRHARYGSFQDLERIVQQFLDDFLLIRP